MKSHKTILIEKVLNKIRAVFWKKTTKCVI